MTRRAIIIGIIGAVLLPVFGYYADHVVRVNRFVAGQFPIAAYGPLVLIVLFLNPLLRRIKPSACFSRRELAVVILGLFVGASIVDNGMLRHFARQLVMPVHSNLTQPGWQRQKLLDDVPDIMLANDGEFDDELHPGFVMGMGKQGEPIAFNRVPWDKLVKPLMFWGVLIFLFGASAVCLAMVVHPQWSRHELLRYPTIEFANTLMGTDDDNEIPIYRKPPFLVGMTVLLAYHLLNGCANWWPDYLVGIPLRFDFMAFRDVFSWVHFGWKAWPFFHPTFWPLAIALAFFLPKDISFSVGIAQPLAFLVTTFLLTYSLIAPSGNTTAGGALQWQRAGSCLALAMMLAYLGRQYYKGVMRSAFTFKPPPEEVSRGSVYAFRVLVCCLFALVIVVSWLGQIPWPFAVAFVLLAMIALLAVSRIIAEVGFFYTQVVWVPVSVLLPLCGGFSLGATAFLSLAIMGIVFCQNIEESLMPFVTQGFKLTENGQKDFVRYGIYAFAAFALAVAVAIPSSLWMDFSYGGTEEPYAAYVQPQAPYHVLDKVKVDLSAKGKLEASETLSTWERIVNIRPNAEFSWCFIAGILVVVGVYLARLRWSKWPIHPVLFLVWDTWASAIFCWTFLAAWFIRFLADKYGNQHSTKMLKIVMVGVIVGELLGGMFWMMVGWIYYSCTGNYPPYYNIFPH